MGKRIDKIKNYNQILLAIAGTIGVIFLLFATFFALEEMSRSFFYNRDNGNNGILAIEETNQLQKDSLRRQIISFNKIEVVDSINQTYIIPVTQANLAAAEKDNEVLGLMNTRSTKYSYERYYGNIYNNLIVYNQKTDQSKIVFDERISIENFKIHIEKDKRYVIIPACQIDSNQDGYLNEKDLQELFIYDLQNNLLTKIKAKENYTTLKAYQPLKANHLIVQFGIDRNGNGTFNSSTEPMIFYKVNLKDMRIEEFINKEQMNSLQSLLEGK